MKVYIDGIGVFGPGMPCWNAARDVLTGVMPFSHTLQPLHASSLLPPTERRRAGTVIKLAFEVARQAVQQAHIDPASLASVFASSLGDTEVLSEICETLASEQRMLSPMRFHNSVHNAAAGYWTIAAGARQPSTSIALHHLTVAAGLLEAVTQALSEQTPVLLVVYDQPFPLNSPLDQAEPIISTFACALVLQPQVTEHSLAQLELFLISSDKPATQMASLEMEQLRIGVPAGRCLTILQALASQAPCTAVLDTVTPNHLHLHIQPIA